MDPLRLERLLIALRQERSLGDQAIDDACALYRAGAPPELTARQIAAALSVDRESYARIYELARRFLVEGEGSVGSPWRRRLRVAGAGAALLALVALGLGHLVPAPESTEAPFVAEPPLGPLDPPVEEPAAPELEWTQEPQSRESNSPWRRPLSPPPAPWVVGLSLLSALLVGAGLWLRSLQPWRVRARALAEQVQRDKVALEEALLRDLQAGYTGDIDYDLGPPAPDRRLRQATERLAGLRASAPGERLDAEATVDAASRSGGQFVPIYAHSRAPQLLVVLVDEGEDSRLYLPRVEAWLGELADAGAQVEVYRFRGAPEELEGRRGVFPLRTVVRAHPDAVALLVHGRLGEVSRGELRGWMTPLRAWPRRAWLDPSSERSVELDADDAEPSRRSGLDPTQFKEVRLDAVNARLARLSGLPHFRLSPEGLAALARHLEPGAGPGRAQRQALGQRPEESRRVEERRVVVARGLIALVPDPTAEHFATLIDDPELRRYGLRPEHFEAAIPALGAGALLRGRVCISDREALKHELALRALLAEESALPPDLIERTRRKLASQIHPEWQRGEVAQISARVRHTLHGLLAASAWGEAEKAALEGALSGAGASLLLERLEDRAADPKTAGALSWVRGEGEGDEVRLARPELRGWAGLLLREALVAGLALAALAFGGPQWGRFDREGVGEMPVDWRLIPPEPPPPVVVEVEPPPSVEALAAAPVEALAPVAAAPVAAAPAEARAVAAPSPALVELAPVEAAPPEVAPAPVPESRCDRPKTHPTMVPMSPGSFRSGDGRDITLTRRYAIANTEVTQAQFAAVMGESKLEALVYDEYQGVALRGADLPMQGVSWYDAVAYCNKLSDLEGLDRAYDIQGAMVTRSPSAKGYRLPTEAEWEYAARAGTRDAYSGTNEDSQLCTVANVADQSALAVFPGRTVADCDDGAVGLAPVCAYAPNRYSLYDMSGNVWEWTWDWYEGHPSETQDPDGPDSGSNRVYRGGSWGYSPANARVAYRDRYSPSARDYNLGFRPARSL